MGANRDLIGDFTVGEDIIDLSLISGSIGFIGSDGFSGGGGAELRVTEAGTAFSIAALDADGDGVADMEIFLFGTVGMTAADFGLA